jgi:hypothetical protein
MEECVKNLSKLVVASLVLFVCLVLVSGLGTSSTVAAPSAADTMADLPPRRLEAAPWDSPSFVPAPPQFLQRRPATATINVTYMTTGQVLWSGTSDQVTCQTWPTDAQAAFNFAKSVWESQLNSTVTIVARVCWGNTGSTTNLGKGGGTTFHRNFDGTPVTSTWYIAALANALAGTDQNGSTAEIENAFNSTRSDWYFGTGSTTPSGKYNFASVAVHELGHGLGFLGSMSYSGGVGYWGWNTTPPTSVSPAAYDRFTENGSGTDLISYTSGTAALGTQLTSNNIYFNGPNANAANGGAPPKLYAPAPWAGGSSYAHLDEDTYPSGNANALMTPYLSSAETNYNPGPVTMGIFKDQGWTTGGTPPVSTKINLPLVANSYGVAPPTGPTPGYWRSSGGSSEFYVTTDRTKVRRFAIIVNLEGCGTYQIYRTIPAGDAAISSNQFSFSGTFYASGTFGSSTTASGTTGLSSYGPLCGAYWTSPGAWSWSTLWQNSTQPTMPVRQVESDTVGFVPATGAGYEALPVE